MPVPAAHALLPSEQQHLPSTIPSHLRSQQQPPHVDTPVLLVNQHVIATSTPIRDTSQQSSPAQSGTGYCTDPTMKADRKPDPLLTSVSTNNPPTTSYENHTVNHSKKRKAAHSERRTSSNGASGAATTATSEDLGATAIEKTKKRAAIDEHRKEEEGMYADEEVSGSMRKKRVVATSRTSISRYPHPHTDSPSSDAVKPEEVVDVENMDEDEAPPSRKSGKDNVASISSVTSATIDSAGKHGARRKGSAAALHLPTCPTHSPTSPKKSQSKDTGEGKGISKSDGSLCTNGNTKPAKLLRQQTTSSSSSTMTIESATVSEVKAHKSGRSKASTQATPVAADVASPPSAAATSSPPAEHGLQKRVLPSRGGILRDKTSGLPIEASLLEPPVVPAGEYILYLADKKVLERATVDPNRVPLATYSGATEEGESSQCLLSSPQSPSATATATSSSKTAFFKSAPPPSAVTHIEVPIFRLCSISQFLQEEKKRKMQLLSKALAKAEAEAATEAMAQAQASTPALVSSRSVSTRQKHKEIFQNQHVSFQTAAPSWALHSTSTHGGRKAMTTNTTLGKIEGDAQEEILTDEVYEKRHRKQEMAEKKVKNREKEKLRHAMYQQQLVVEKLRHMEINRLMPISAFRSLQKTIEQEHQLRESGGPGPGSGAGSGTDEAPAPQHHAPISLAAARIMQDEYHRRLLREAEENLRRYEQLGLGETSTLTMAPTYSPFSRTKNRLAAMVPAPVVDERPSSATHGPGGKLADSKQDKKDRSSSVHQRSESRAMSVLKSNTGDGHSRKRVKTVDTATVDNQKEDASASASETGRSKTKTSSGKSVATTTAVSIASSPSSQKTAVHKAAEEPPRPPKPITTFFKPGSIFATGGRKSSRVALAFGERVPILERMDFELPKDGFGDLLLERAGENPILLMELNRMGMPGGIKEVSAAVSEVANAMDVVASSSSSSPSSSSSSTSSTGPLSSSSSSSVSTSLSSLSAKSP